MGTEGEKLQGGDNESRREAARALGQARTPAKSAAAKERGEKLKGIPRDPETVEKIRAKQRARWAAVRAEKAAAAALLPAVEKKRAGRPSKPIDPDAPKRGGGRPKKQDAQTPATGG